MKAMAVIIVSKIIKYLRTNLVNEMKDTKNCKILLKEIKDNTNK
jgi:hypothetical protein